jgi:hypothetical protein
MKLWGIFRFEVAYQARRVWPWLIFAVLFVLSFLMARDTSLADAMYEDFFANSPFAMAKTTVVGSLVWLLVAAVIAGEAAARDVATRMYPLVYAAPIRKVELLGGRFLAALALNAVLLLAVQAGMMLGIYTAGTPAKFLAPFRPEAYLTNYAFIALPNAIVATALQFSFAIRTGRAMASYAGSMFLMFMSFFVASLLLFKRGLGTLLDPIGMRFIIEDLAHDWTKIERNVRLVSLEGALLGNRLLWFGVALAALTFTFVRFRFEHRTERTWWRRRTAHAPTPSGIGVTASTPVAVPHVQRSFGIAIQARKTLAVAAESFRTIAKSWAGLAMLVGIPMLTVLIVIDQMQAIAVPLVPTTARVLAELTGPIANDMSRWLIIPLLTVFFAGELVWREREAGLGEITDAMPGSEWTSLTGKFLGLGLALVAFTALQMAAGIVAQVLMGYQHFEIGLYLKILFGLQLPEYLLFVVFALVVHVVVDQKYVGHLVAIVAYVFIAVLAGLLGIEHNLLVFGAGPRWSYTEMRGFGPSIAPWLWFKLYWASWALLLAVVACLLWVRGREHGLRVRLRSARRRLGGSTARIGAAAIALILMTGGFVFYNTNVLNRYSSAVRSNDWRAEYERRYRKYENTPQPELTGTTLRVEFHPTRGAAEIRGSYRLVNASARPVDSIHVATPTGGVETGAVTFDRTATLAVDDPQHGYRIYDLERPLAPGDTLRLDFTVHTERHGFTNRGVDPSITDGGSAFTASWLPLVGYQRRREILSASDRRDYGLEPRALIASLSDDEGREPPARGGGIAFDAVIGTDDDQVAVAPGALRRTWSENGRRYFHYATSAPIGSEWYFFSAPYAVREVQWEPPASQQSARQNVSIKIFYDPRHTAHLDRMTRAVRASMDYYAEQFGPYPYNHLTLVEHPGASGTGMHAEASFIFYGQGIPFWIPKDEAGELDFPSAVLGHELAHEWGVPYATVEGAPFLSEGLAWYSAIQLVKKSRGSEQLRQLLSFMRQPYPYRPIRRGEPLLRALDTYMSYRKGPFSMYALSEYVGTARVNGAIRRLIETHDAPGAPLATTLDLYRELQAITPDSLRPLLHDLFEVNTFWTFDTKEAAAVETEEGAWQVTFDVEARKVVVDSAGVETRLPMDEWVEIGIFAPADKNEELGKPIYVGKHRVRSGRQTITVTVPQKPDRAGIDPYNLLDWETGDNIEAVTIRRMSR